MKGPPNLDDILSNINSNQQSSMNVDLTSNYSESDIEQYKGIELKSRNRGRNSDKKSISLDF